MLLQRVQVQQPRAQVLVVQPLLPQLVLLQVLARVRNVPVGEDEPRQVIEERIRHETGWRAAWRKKRRRIAGSILSRVLESAVNKGAAVTPARPPEAGRRRPAPG